MGEAPDKGAPNTTYAGMGVLTRLDLPTLPLGRGEGDLKGRWSSVRIGGGLKGGALTVVSLYGFVGEGLSDNNKLLLREVAEHVAEQGGQWVIAGDFNLTPTELSESGWLARTRGAVISRTTTGQEVDGRDIDYFVVPRDTTGRFTGLRTVASGIPTHKAIGLTIRGGHLGTVTEVRMPRRFPEIAKEASGSAREGEGTLEAKWEDWCRRAEDYLTEATGVGTERGFRGRGRGLSTKRQSMVRKLQARQKGGAQRGGAGHLARQGAQVPTGLEAEEGGTVGHAKGRRP